MSAKVALLRALLRGEAYGLELIERVKQLSKGSVVLSPGSVYPALRELEREGLVEHFDGPPAPERGGRPRTFFRITQKGKEAALKQAESIAVFWDLELKPGWS